MSADFVTQCFPECQRLFHAFRGEPLPILREKFYNSPQVREPTWLTATKPWNFMICLACMLRYLKVSNLAIIDKVEVEFREGFNVLTGETGAGKSILIGALDLLLGGRVSPDLIRTGEDEALVEGLFEIPEDHPLPPDLAADIAGTGELILSRKFSRAGRSRCSMNGNLATVAMLQSVGRSLISIFGQHEHRVLLDPEEHIDILDTFGTLATLSQDVSDAFSAWTRATRELGEAAKRLGELERQAKENAASSKELSEAGLKEGEEEEILQQREILKKATQIRERAYDAYQKLYSRSGSVIGELSEIKKKHGIPGCRESQA